MTGTRCSHLTPVGNRSPTKEQDRFLPIANVSRIMKKSLPANAKISKEAKETVQGCVSEFITFITGEASDRCQREKRKTINGDDLLWAMTTLGFEKYVVPLKVHLSKYREIEGEKSSVTTQGDQSVSPPEEPYHGAAKLGGVTVANGNTTTVPTMGYMMGLSSFNGGLYSQFPEEGLIAHGDWKELKTGQISYNG